MYFTVSVLSIRGTRLVPSSETSEPMLADRTHQPNHLLGDAIALRDGQGIRSFRPGSSMAADRVSSPPTGTSSASSTVNASSRTDRQRARGLEAPPPPRM